MIAPVTALCGRHLLDLADLSRDELRQILDLAHAIEARWRERPLKGAHIAMLFQKPSHRTRVSFEVGIARLGGATTTLGEQDVQLGVRELVSDAARVLDCYVDGMVARLRTHEDLLALARAAEKPVINALTDRSHPCQVLATSLIEAVALTGLAVTIIGPRGYYPKAAVIERAAGTDRRVLRVNVSEDLSAADGATAVYADVWPSMGQGAKKESLSRIFSRYQVNGALMDRAPGAVFMHSLPAHRWGEVTDKLIEGPQAVVFQQAGNRLYGQMALQPELFGKGA